METHQIIGSFCLSYCLHSIRCLLDSYKQTNKQTHKEPKTVMEKKLLFLVVLETSYQAVVPQDLSILKTHLHIKKEKEEMAKLVENGNIFSIFFISIHVHRKTLQSKCVIGESKFTSFSITTVPEEQLHLPVSCIFIQR